MLRQHQDFNVFQLMRLMLRDTDKRLPIGRRLRFRADLSAAFPASEFAQVTPLPADVDTGTDAVDGAVPGVAAAGGATSDEAREQGFEISTANFCVASVTGPLPEPFTEWARELAALRAPAMADFFDIFNQRANLLRFQLKQQMTPGLDDSAPDQTEMAMRLAALVGLDDPKLAAQVPLPRRAWLGIAGLLANRRKQASTLVEVLGLALGARVTLTENVGAWHELDERDRCALGRSNHRLGQTCVVGRRVWDQQARVRLDIGVVDYEAMCGLLPPAPAAPVGAAPFGAAGPLDTISALAAAGLPAGIGLGATPRPGYTMLSGLVKLLVDRLADVEVVLHVADPSVLPVPLPQPARGTDTSSMRLGQSAWLAGTPAHRHATRPVRFLIATRQSAEAA